MAKYNEARTVFGRGLEWYILPGSEKKARWWKRYIQVPRTASYWCVYMNEEERDRLVEIYESDGYAAYAGACEYLSDRWFDRKRYEAAARKDAGKARLEG